MKQLSNLTKIMFCVVAVLLVMTVMLGIATAVKDSKENDENTTLGTTVTPIPTKTASTNGEGTSDPSATPGTDATQTPAPTKGPVSAGGHKIALDPGQQEKAMTEDEPVGPGASSTVDKMSYGATSTTTGKREHEWTLPFTLKLKEELTARGYEVFLTREEANVTVSNGERAQLAGESGAEIYLSIQADAASNTEANGIYSQIPSQGNAYVGDLHSKSKSLAKAIQNSLIAETGAKDRGVQENDKVAAINYSEIPVAVLQLGFMSNKEEDTRLWSEEYQDKLVKAICDGIEEYFKNQE